MHTEQRRSRRTERGTAASSSTRAGRFALVGALSLALVAGSVTAAQAEETFATQQSGTYAGLPLFDGDPAHLQEYLDVLVGYAGLEASVNWANGVRGDFTIPTGPNAGRVVPGSLQFDEGAQGVSTDFPAMIGLGQSWNPALVGEIGEVIGDEALYEDDYLASISAFNPMVSAALQDIRPNPLSGRLDEGIGEDPELAQAMVDSMSRGISGIDEEENTDGFWTKAMVDTKHFTNYAGQWFRRTGSNDVGARSMMEYWSRAPMKGFESGAIGAFMSSYGRTNGVPNVISPLVKEAQSRSPWGMYTVPDNGSENRLQVPNAYSNGFDTSYSPTWEDAAALFTIADAGSIAVNRGADQLRAGLIDRIRKGTLGVTEQDVYDLAKDQVTPLVRMGLFNERGADGLPLDYPFLDQSALSAEPIDYSVPEHQQAGLQAAEESLVLLKNSDGILPLKKDASLAVAGPLSQARFLTTYATNTPPVENGGLTPVQGIDAVSDGSLASATDGDIVRLKSVATGNYVTVAPTTAAVAATTQDAAAAATFESFAWGQEAYGLRSTADDTWVQYADNAVTANQVADFNTPATTLPYRIRPVDNGDGTVSFVVGSYTESFVGGFETAYYTAGRYLTVDPATGAVGVSAVLGSEENAAALRTDSAKFRIETTRAAGTLTAEAAKDYAVVVVGAPTRNSSGEGADRSDLAMGEDQYRLVENVSKAYPGRTIVVVSSVYPVLMDRIQDNDDVAAIVQAPYGGQYGNYALGRVLVGDATPTGRLTNTWYSSTDALPALDRFAIPQGEDVTKTLDSIDPRITVDMTAADPPTPPDLPLHRCRDDLRFRLRPVVLVVLVRRRDGREGRRRLRRLRRRDEHGIPSDLRRRPGLLLEQGIDLR